jgi:serine/threonine-protein kinase
LTFFGNRGGQRPKYVDEISRPCETAQQAMNPHLPTSPPALLGGRYRPVAKLGDGGMGVVLQAIDTHTGGFVALKILHESLAGDPESIERLRTEAEVAMLLIHPGIVRVHDLVMPPAASPPFFAMEHLTGRTLYDHVQQHAPLPVHVAIDIALQVLSALATVHRKGIVHRDVKPGNIFLCDPLEPAPTAKLIDFGIARLLPGAAQAHGLTPHTFRTREGLCLGTARYLSPEQVCGPAVDHRSDLYAMGVVLYAMLTGRGPFDHIPSTAALLQAQVAQLPVPPSTFAVAPIPRELDELVMAALAKSAEARLASAEQFSAALDDIHARLRAPVGWLRTNVFDSQALDPTPAPKSPPRPAAGALPLSRAPAPSNHLASKPQRRDPQAPAAAPGENAASSVAAMALPPAPRQRLVLAVAFVLAAVVVCLLIVIIARGLR